MFLYFWGRRCTSQPLSNYIQRLNTVRMFEGNYVYASGDLWKFDVLSRGLLKQNSFKRIQLSPDSFISWFFILSRWDIAYAPWVSGVRAHILHILWHGRFSFRARWLARIQERQEPRSLVQHWFLVFPRRERFRVEFWLTPQQRLQSEETPPGGQAVAAHSKNSTYTNPILPGWHSDPSCTFVKE